jgi:tRNA(Arg) A34 adenosine deaminase TadA
LPKSQLTSSINYWKEFLGSYESNLVFLDDFFALETCKLALEAVESGNFGIGSIIVNSNSEILSRGYNQVFHPYFRSDRHGEMVAMEKFEDQYKEVANMKGYTLYTSLESCPMCLTRLITSGCEKVVHVADDPLGGMVHLKYNLPPIWSELVKRQTFAKANCSVELEAASRNIFMLNVEELNAILFQRLGKNQYDNSTSETS